MVDLPRQSPVYRYRVFGVDVASPFELSELDQSHSASSDAWRVEACPGVPPVAPLEPTGSETVYGSVRVRSLVADDFARLVFDDTGTFDVVPSSRVIRWYAGAHANLAAVRADLLGRVLAMAIHCDGAQVLHASAVSIDDAVVAFLGPKHAGKSTLAMALVRRGARIVTDDALAVRVQADGALAAPGVQRVRLWPDSARSVGLTVPAADGTKPTIDDLDAHLREADVRRLVACYVLRPVSGEGRIVRGQLSEVHAAVAAVSFSKLGGLAGGRLSVEVLERSTSLARVVPMYAVDIPRDLDRLDDVVGTVMAWHRWPAPNVAAVR